MAANSRFGSSLSPLIIRLALAFIFISAGLPKLKMMEYTGDQAQRLVDLGVVPKPAPPADGTTAPVPVTARGLHQITLMLDAAHHPQPVFFGWLAALSEVGGGIAMIVGLLTRIGALGLCTTMGYAFYFTTWQKLAALGAAAATPPGSSASCLQSLMQFSKLEMMDQLAFFIQLACFAMAFSILVGGPGRFSLDAVLFGRGKGGGGNSGGSGGGGGGGASR